MSIRTRPSKQYTNADFVGGALVALVVGAVAARIILTELTPLLGEGKPDWSGSRTALRLSLLAVTFVVMPAAYWAFIRTRVAMRRVSYEEQWTACLREKKCPACGYDLRGTVEPRCPECGERFEEHEWPPTSRPAG